MKKITLLSYILLFSVVQLNSQSLYEGFEGSSIPLSWDHQIDVGTSSWQYKAIEVGMNNSRSGILMAVYKGSSQGDQARLITPKIAISSLSNPSVRFYMANIMSYSSLAVNKLTVLYKQSETSSWVELQTFDTPQAYWREVVLDLPNKSDDYYLAFQGVSQEGEALIIDDVFVEEKITCRAPSGVEISALSNDQVTINWDDSPGSTWEIVVQQSNLGYPTASTTASLVLSNSFDANLLIADTNYEAYIRTQCSNTIQSDWIGPFEFKTKCLKSPTYHYQFATNLLECWSESRFNDVSERTNNIRSNWFIDDFRNDPSTSKSFRISIRGANDLKDWLISPLIDLTSSEPHFVSVDLAVTESVFTNPASIGSDDQIRFLISEDYGETWSDIDIYNSSNQISFLGETKIYDLSGYTGEVVQFAFWASNGSVEDPMFSFFVDNFKVDKTSVLNAQINVIANENKVMIYPNPVEENLFVQVKEERVKSFSVINTIGQVVYRSSILDYDQKVLRVALADLPKGVYVLELKLGINEEVVLKKFVKE